MFSIPSGDHTEWKEAANWDLAGRSPLLGEGGSRSETGVGRYNLPGSAPHPPQCAHWGTFPQGKASPRQIPIYRGGTWSHPPSTSKTGYPGWDNPFLVRVFLWDFWKRCTIPALFGIEPVPVSSTSLRDASEAGGTLPRAKNSPPDCFYGSLRCRRPFESRPEYQKTRYPNGYLVFWYAGRDSNPQPSEPESDALSIEPPAHTLIAWVL